MSVGARTILIVVLVVLATGGACAASCLLLAFAPEEGTAPTPTTSAPSAPGETLFYCEGMATFETCGQLRCTRQSVVSPGVGPNLDDAKTTARISCQTKVLALGGHATCIVACQHKE